MKTLLAIHKDSTKFISSKVEQGQEMEFCNLALAQFQRDLNDPDITPHRISIFEIEGEFRILSAKDMYFLQNPNQPVNIVTHGGSPE